MTDSERAFVVSGEYPNTFRKGTICREAKIVHAENADDAAVKFARGSSIAANRAGIDITVQPVQESEAAYRAQYENPEPGPEDKLLAGVGDSYGSLVVVGECVRREVYRG